MTGPNRTSKLLDIICEKAAMLDAFNSWKIINLSPNIAELKFDITEAEIGPAISDKLKISDFKVKFLYNHDQKKPLFDVYQLEKDSNGKYKNFTIGCWITSRDFEDNEEMKVYLRIMLEHILKYETKSKEKR